MTLQELQQLFYKDLDGIYPRQEIKSFFFWLLEVYAEVSSIHFLTYPNDKITSIQQTQFEAALSRLKKEEPIQYILGEMDYGNIRLKVDKNVLIPRPETLELINWIVEDYATRDLSILDIGTGSGCIAISLKYQIKQAEVSAFDISEKALSVARKNAALNQTKIDFKKVDILQPPKLDKTYDVIVSNPPYVRILEKEMIAKNVLDYEPHTALFVEDHNALIFYEKIIDFAAKYLKQKGAVYFEINQYLKADLEKLLSYKTLSDYTFRKDIFGKWRQLKIQL